MKTYRFTLECSILFRKIQVVVTSESEEEATEQVRKNHPNYFVRKVDMIDLPGELTNMTEGEPKV